MVEVATGGRGTKAIRTEYPVEEGLTAGTTKRTNDSGKLEAEEDKTFFSSSEGL